MPNMVFTPDFDPALLARYDLAGPPYACYPTPNRFRADFDEVAWRVAARASNEEPIPCPLSLNVCLPFGIGLIDRGPAGRDIRRDMAHVDRYLERLYREIELVAPLFDRDRSVRQLRVIGAVPRFPDATRLGELMESLARHFSFSHAANREYTIAVDPRVVDAADIREMAELGFNHLSLDLRDLGPRVPTAVDHGPDFEQACLLVGAARGAGFRSVSVDLGRKWTGMDLADIQRTLDQVVAWGSDRLIISDDASCPNASKAADLANATTRAALSAGVPEQLGSAGYVHLGLGQFVRDDDELARAQRAGTLQRNLHGYTIYGECDMVGLGAGAISRIGDSCSRNAHDPIGYGAALDTGRLPVACGLQLDEDDVIRAELIDALLCRGIVDKAAFGARHRLLFDEYFTGALLLLRPLVADGLVRDGAGQVQVTSPGRLLLRIIVRCFDAYLDETASMSRYPHLI